MLNNSLNSFSNSTHSSNDNIYNTPTVSPKTISTNNNINSAESISEAKAAFDSLPVVIQQALTEQKRIVCMANNPSITTESLEKLLQPTDLLVLFNDFIHADYLTNDPIASQLPKLLFFRQNGDSLLHFGMPPRSNNVGAIDTMAKQASLGLLFSNQPYQFPTPSDDPSPTDDPITPNRILAIPSKLTTLLNNKDHCRVLSEYHPVVADYPSFTNIHSSAPSSGFLLYRLLLAARQHVQQLQKDATPLQIMMLGFNDEDKTGYFWSGHNWQFERQEMSVAPAGVHLIRQY